MKEDPLIALVTGASSGIGLGLVNELSDRGIHVIAVSRKKKRTAKILKKASSRGEIKWFPADLSSIEDVKKLSEKIKEKYHKIDYLFNIAGCLKLSIEKTVDNLEYMFATNYLSHFLLTNKLIPLLKNSPSAKIFTISGEGHRECFPNGQDFDRIDYDKLLTFGNFESGMASRQIVLAKVLFSYELAERIKGLNIQSATFCPGLVRTNIMAEFPWYVRTIAGIQMLFMASRSPADLAQDICNLAFNFRDINGKYYVIRKSGIKREISSRASNHRPLAKKLWNVSEYLTEEQFDAKYYNS